MDIKYIWDLKKQKLKQENIMKLSINVRWIKKTTKILKLAINQIQIEATEEDFIILDIKNIALLFACSMSTYRLHLSFQLVRFHHLLANTCSKCRSFCDIVRNIQMRLHLRVSLLLSLSSNFRKNWWLSGWKKPKH